MRHILSQPKAHQFLIIVFAHNRAPKCILWQKPYPLPITNSMCQLLSLSIFLQSLWLPNTRYNAQYTLYSALCVCVCVCDFLHYSLQYNKFSYSMKRIEHYSLFESGRFWMRHNLTIYLYKLKRSDYHLFVFMSIIWRQCCSPQ